jgi:hypothetical protein
VSDGAEPLDLRAWHADGHKLTVKLGVWPDGKRKSGTIRVEAECPPDSVCHRFREQAGHRDGQPYCFVRGEIESFGPLDFLDADLDAPDLPDDWSSRVDGLEIEWKDEGEDGIRWRPKLPA